MDDALIVVSIVSGLFSLAAILLLQMNWFKRERFKFEIDTKKKEYNINFKKMARDLGLNEKTGSYRAAANTAGDTIGGLLNIVKGLDQDKLDAIQDLLGGLGGGGSEEPAAAGGLGGLLEFISTPEGQQLLKGVTDGIKNRSGGGAAVGGDNYL